MSVESSIKVIINAQAGLGYDQAWVAGLSQQFRLHGITAEVVLAQDGAALLAQARLAVAAQVATVVAGGGDGTINAVASVLAGSGVRLGVLPLGTLNHFARDLKIPLALAEAVANVAHGVPLAVDVGEVNGQLFLNNSSLGLYPAIVRDRERQQRHLGRAKWPAFGRAVLSVLRRYPYLNVQLRVQQAVHARRTPFVFIGNNEYLQGRTLGARDHLDRGVLSVYVAQRPTRWGLLKLALRAMAGRLATARDFDLLLTPELVVETHHKHIRVATDGEVRRMTPPLRYRSRPAALLVMVPAAVAQAVAVAPATAAASASAG